MVWLVLAVVLAGSVHDKDYRAEIGIVADRAMTVRSTDGVFTSGSYYCHYQGCEKRVGVDVRLVLGDGVTVPPKR